MTELIVPTEWIVAFAFATGIYIARNEMEHRAVKLKLKKIAKHLGCE